ncbi:MAG: hypothetical protein NXH95_21900 [Pseudomonadaceae bacterium]|nr:hypothetical protein [Pseudomonadaceae bacterium]
MARRRANWSNWFWGLVIFGAVVYLNRESMTPELDLGTVQYPRFPETYDTTEHLWRAAGLARTRIAFDHGHKAIQTLEADHLFYGRQIERAYQRGSDSQLGTNCQGDYWSCVYSIVFQRNADDLEPLLNRISQGLEDQRWTAVQATRWLLRFVQDIPYRIPEEHAFGVLPPALVVSQNWGDCDSKSLLLLHLLRRVGIDAQITVSRIHKHAMVGVFVPTTGGTFSYRNRDYAWAETTSNAPLGWISPEMLLPDDWQVTPVRHLN